MLFNITKCKVMHFGNKNPHFQYVMNGVLLQEVEEEKDLGVIVHNSLKPTSQVASAVMKANQVLGQLCRAVTYRDKHTFVKLYMRYVRPHLEYCIQAWAPSSQADRKLRESVQIRAVNMVSGLTGKTYEEKLHELGLMSLEERMIRGDMIETYKIISGKENVNPGTWFMLLEDEKSFMTRNCSGHLNLCKPPSKLGIRKNFFSIRVVDTWNQIPDSVKKAVSTNQFKNFYDKLGQ